MRIGADPRGLIRQIEIRERIRCARSRDGAGRAVQAGLRQHPDAAAVAVRAVVHGERRTALHSDERGHLPSAHERAHKALAVACERHLPDRPDREPVADVEVGVAVVEPRVERIQQAQIEVVGAFAEQ